jgi:HAD superfamily hydrolase (TIGR01459 family)
LPSISELSGRYRVWFCDVWGVVHDGFQPFAASVEGLKRHRGNGGIVILVSNSPRTALGVERQLVELGVDPASHDAIVTSGDVTRQLIIDHGGGKVYLVGPERDHSIFHGLAVARVPLAECHAVLCTGLFDEENETAENYAALFAEMQARHLTMICANPDKIVKKGNRVLPCAGALAEAYAARGGEVVMAGKPFPPIYDLAVQEAGRLAGRPVSPTEILAIGDGPETDIRGAAAYGLAAVLVADGVTDASHGLEAVARGVKRMVPDANILATVHDLSWDGKWTSCV